MTRRGASPRHAAASRAGRPPARSSPEPGEPIGAGRPTGSDVGAGADGTRAARRARRTRTFVPAVDRFNRLLLGLVGLFLTVAGAVVLLAGSGVFGSSLARRPVLTEDTRSFAADHGWFWPVLGTAAGLVALFAIGWLAAQRSTGRLRGLYVTDDAVGGVHLDASALTDAVADDVLGNTALRSARVIMRGRSRRPVLQIAAEMAADADARAVRSDIEGRVLGRARCAVGRPDLSAEIDLAVHAGTPARVH